MSFGVGPGARHTTYTFTNHQKCGRTLISRSVSYSTFLQSLGMKNWIGRVPGPCRREGPPGRTPTPNPFGVRTTRMIKSTNLQTLPVKQGLLTQLLIPLYIPPSLTIFVNNHAWTPVIGREYRLPPNSFRDSPNSFRDSPDPHGTTARRSPGHRNRYLPATIL
jgi:hypothetical protein